MVHILFERERAVLEFIVQYSKRFGYAPTLSEICKGVGVNSPATVCEHIYKLEDKGFLRRIPGKRRGIEIIEASYKVAGDEGALEVPVLGELTPGQPIKPVEDANAFIPVANSMIKVKNTVYFLRMIKPSLIEDGMLEGDYVLIEHRTEANNGDLVVVVLPSGYTAIKRIYFEQHRILLQSPYSDVMPIYATEVRVQGRVIGLVRLIDTAADPMVKSKTPTHNGQIVAS